MPPFRSAAASPPKPCCSDVRVSPSTSSWCRAPPRRQSTATSPHRHARGHRGAGRARRGRHAASAGCRCRSAPPRHRVPRDAGRSPDHLGQRRVAGAGHRPWRPTHRRMSSHVFQGCRRSQGVPLLMRIPGIAARVLPPRSLLAGPPRPSAAPLRRRPRRAAPRCAGCCARGRHRPGAHAARPAPNVFVADPKVAEVRPASPTSLFVFGVGAGRTTVAALDADGHLVAQYDVTVAALRASARARRRPRSPPAAGQPRSSVAGRRPRACCSAARCRARPRRRGRQHRARLSRRRPDRRQPAHACRRTIQVTLRVRIAEMSRNVVAQSRHQLAGARHDRLNRASSPRSPRLERRTPRSCLARR